jgi:hypothetical protein
MVLRPGISDKSDLKREIIQAAVVIGRVVEVLRMASTRA